MNTHQDKEGLFWWGLYRKEGQSILCVGVGGGGNTKKDPFCNPNPNPNHKTNPDPNPKTNPNPKTIKKD